MAQGKFTTSPTPSNIVSAVNAMVDDIAGKAASSHNHSASNITSGTLAVARGGTGVTANPSILTNLGSTSAASVFAASPRPGVTGTLPIVNGGTGLTAAPSMLTNLGSTSAASPLQASPRPGVTGTLPIANGGTGATTASQARVNLGLVGASYEATDYIIETYRNGTEWYEVYKSGKVRQGGYCPTAGGTVTFLKPFANKDYIVNACGNDRNGYKGSWSVGVFLVYSSSSTTQMTVACTTGEAAHTSPYYWTAEGQGA